MTDANVPALAESTRGLMLSGFNVLLLAYDPYVERTRAAWMS